MAGGGGFSKRCWVKEAQDSGKGQRCPWRDRCLQYLTICSCSPRTDYQVPWKSIDTGRNFEGIPKGWAWATLGGWIPHGGEVCKLLGRVFLRHPPTRCSAQCWQRQRQPLLNLHWALAPLWDKSRLLSEEEQQKLQGQWVGGHPLQLGKGEDVQGEGRAWGTSHH